MKKLSREINNCILHSNNCILYIPHRVLVFAIFTFSCFSGEILLSPKRQGDSLYIPAGGFKSGRWKKKGHTFRMAFFA